ncbi:hypothetical protein PoB_001968100 [Plakobranchus ocellatus]|uniref:Uncharacterized protein n=1 Tax=Plakobranchus ocellatus TaxID=259542 RepID=A0AAV3ZEX9_9GAST|nr:hypothetical protein PoB_001968100 [Plakobranchus ocellatus]
MKKKPELTIDGDKGGPSLTPKNGDLIKASCSAYLGLWTSMTMGVVYKDGVDGWYAHYTFHGYTKMSRTDRRHLIKNLGDFPGLPLLIKLYKRPGNIIVGGETIIAKCEALVATGGTIVWELITSSKKYQWKGGKNQRSQKFTDWVTLIEKESIV